MTIALTKELKTKTYYSPILKTPMKWEQLSKDRQYHIKSVAEAKR